MEDKVYTAADLKRRERANRAMFWTMIRGAILRRRSRAIMAVIASLVGAATLFVLVMVCIVVPAQMTEEMRAYGANLVVTSNQTGATENGIQKDMVEHTTEMVRATGFGETHATYRYDTVRVNSASYQMAGINPNEVRSMNKFWDVTGSWPNAENQVLIGTDVAERLSVKIGQSITVGYVEDDAVNTILDTEGTRMQVVGTVSTGGNEDSMLYVTNGTLDTLTGQNAQNAQSAQNGQSRGADVIEYSSEASGADLDKLVTNINDMKSMNVTAQAVSKISQANASIIAMLTTLFWIISLVIVALTLVGVSTTMTSIVSQRRNEIGLRKALGASNRSIAVEFYVESALYGVAGGLLGVLVGSGVAWVLIRTVFDRETSVNVGLGAACVAVAALIAVVASILPVRKASRIDPAVVLREE
ncbi:ABC transporter permease [Alloscardovia macacae]|uniref:ABC transporter permease n=1 Tax=Alloscardovia macacae TaxID=1160091 RepID=A0A1Y2T175_9BIFI|nr:FtsX-like permease family protein [Alloscardovia macacae]OTA26726.1 ABC transporter permease [Alloscardovia macacae]OTA29592.1 ABC transporter permease [Alloscardovia macacae]